MHTTYFYIDSSAVATTETMELDVAQPCTASVSDVQALVSMPSFGLDTMTSVSGIGVNATSNQNENVITLI